MLHRGTPPRERDFSGNGVAGGVARGTNAPPTVQRRTEAAAPVAVAGSVSGEGAVQMSREARRMQDAVSVDEQTVAAVRRVDGRTFTLQEGVWTDTRYREADRLPVTSVRFGSDEYFALVQRLPELARYFALGEQVVVVHDGRVYRSTAN